jgi:hypothetical protein
LPITGADSVSIYVGILKYLGKKKIFPYKMTTIIHLNQDSFANGTYRIKSSGKYILDENIIFNPTETRPDIPSGTGWFAAITVETDDVDINLNCHSIEAAAEFLNSHQAGVFAIIELDNCPFSGSTYGYLGSNFTGDTSFVHGNNIRIHNGSIGRTSYWGIHGDNNTRVIIDNVKIADFELAGIQLDGATQVLYNRVKISGLEHPISVTADTTTIYYFNLLIQEVLPFFPPPFAGFAQKIITDFNAYVTAHPEIYNRVLEYPENNYYGIAMSSGTTDYFGFPATPTLCQKEADLSGGTTVKYIGLKEVQVQQLQNKPREIVAIGARVPGDTNGNYINLNNLGMFGVLNWFDVFDTSGNFNPNPYIVGLSFLALALLSVPSVESTLPPQTPDILIAIIRGDSATFFANAIPLFGNASFSPYTLESLFGVKIDCSEKVILDKSQIRNLRCLGNPGIDLASIPGASNYPNLTQTRYIGNDVRAIEFAVGTDINLKNIKISNIYSNNGFVYGIDLISTTHVKIKDVCITKLAGSGSILSSANQPSQVYGLHGTQTDNLKYCKVYVNQLYAPPNGQVHPISIDQNNIDSN